jgi:phosphoribosyl 1,2-cyclic phosphate phosphodiesterase
MTLTFTILGCGFSGGVPRPGFGWGACNPDNPRNRRRRCSLLVEQRGSDGGCTRVLVDTSPDLREQLLDANVNELDGVVFTHEHADHLHGIDDLRSLVIRHKRRIDVYFDDSTATEMHTRFGYCFKTPPGSSYPPILNEHRIAPNEPVTITGEGGPMTVIPFRLDHGGVPSLGLRFGTLAYSPDIKDVPEESLPFLQGLDVWIVDALFYRQHYSHFSVADALAWIERMQPKRGILTHMHSDLDYDALRAVLPPNVEPAYDGLRITLPDSPER